MLLCDWLDLDYLFWLETLKIEPPNQRDDDVSIYGFIVSMNFYLRSFDPHFIYIYLLN